MCRKVGVAVVDRFLVVDWRGDSVSLTFGVVGVCALRIAWHKEDFCAREGLGFYLAQCNNAAKNDKLDMRQDLTSCHVRHSPQSVLNEYNSLFYVL